MTRARAGWLAGAWLVAAGCATAPPQPVLKEGPVERSKAETPEVPYSAPPPKEAAAAEGQPAAGGATVVKPVPAPDSTVTASPAEVPPPPREVTDGAILSAFQRALEASNKGDVLTAERELKDVVGRNGQLDYGWTNLGVLYERQALPDQAEIAYKKALVLRPDQELAWDYRTRLNCRAGRASQIEGELRAGILEHPAALGLRTALVYALIYQGKYEPAAGEAKKVLKADERNVRAMQLLAQVYFREGKNELAKMVLENARAIDSNDAGTQNALGLVFLALKAKPAALEAFRQAATLRPDFAEAKNNYGALLNESQDFENAVHELEGAVNAAPDFVAARLNLGNAYRGKQELAKAISQYRQVLRLKPALNETYFNLAILHLDSELPNVDNIERLKTAISYFEQYRDKGGRDERVDQYLKDANKGIEKEERRKEREKKDALKRVEREASEKKKAEEDRVAAEKKAAEDSADKAKKDAEAKVAAEKKAAADAESAAKAQAAAEKKSAAEAEAAAKREAADKVKADKKAAVEAADKAKADAEAKKKAAADKKAQEAAAKKGGAVAPASKLGDDDETPKPPPSSGKLGEDEK